MTKHNIEDFVLHWQQHTDSPVTGLPSFRVGAYLIRYSFSKKKSKFSVVVEE